MNGRHAGSFDCRIFDRPDVKPGSDAFQPG
jgi:hypothetical protein